MFKIAISIFFVVIFSAMAFAETQYKLPPKRVIEILDQPPTPILVPSPRGEFYLLLEFTNLVDLQTLAQPMLRLAGLRILPNLSTQQRFTFITKITVKKVDGSDEVTLRLPLGTKAGKATWAPNGKCILVPVFYPNGVALWVFDPVTGFGRALTKPNLNTILLPSHVWMRDGRNIIVPCIPEDRGSPPVPPLVPESPIIEETSGKVAKLRTYQDLLKTSFDENLFEYYAKSQFWIIDIETGHKRKLGKPDLYREVSVSPDGRFLLIERLRRPFSRMVPEELFAKTIEVWDLNGDVIANVADLPAAETLPIQGVRVGPRYVHWQPLNPAVLIWTEALDDGDPAKKVPFRERIMAWAFPFKGNPVELFKLPQRFAGIDWLNKKNLGLFSDYDRDRKWIVTRLFEIGKTRDVASAKIIFNRSVKDEYNDSGELVETQLADGQVVKIFHKGCIFLAGEGATPEGKRPFLRQMRLSDGKVWTLFQSELKFYESFVGFIDKELKSFITSRESPQNPPNYFLRRIKSKKVSDPCQLTSFPDPAPELSKIKKELVKYTRGDGVPLSGILYYPVDYKAGTRVPTIIWAYPREYVDISTAGQVRSTENRFLRLEFASVLFFLLHGYAVLYNAEIPVVGHPETANNTYIEQVTASAKAAVEFLVRKGVADPKRICVGGHSYGANMVAHLLAHTDLFAAGIARSGAYNRTLTPFGFQGERRTFWEVPEIYLKLSPFTYADKIKKPLLLIHGELDENSGTFPMQSERLFAAIRGAGGTARLVLLPFEGHAYRARESVLHVIAEMFDWCDRYLKFGKTDN